MNTPEVPAYRFRDYNVTLCDFLRPSCSSIPLGRTPGRDNSLIKAIRFHQHGGPEVLRYEEVPTPAPGAGEVLVALRAAALNHLDLFVRNGIPGVKLPHIGGADGAGMVLENGPGAGRYGSGIRVFFDPGISDGTCDYCRRGENSLCDHWQLMGENRDGTFAQAVVVPEVNLRPIPQGLSFEEAAAFPLVFLTAWRMVVSKARVQAGETVLILGIGGGVAIAALQIARMLGARVFVTSGSDAKLARAKELGAEVLINHTEKDFSREVWSITAKRGVDVVVDDVGAATWDRSIRSLARGGRLVTCGATSGPKPEEDLRRIFAKQITIYGSTMGTREDWAALNEHLARGDLKPVVDRTFPLEQAAAAQEMMARGDQFGKLVLTIPQL
ncbi:MAG TPA: zinc-binding dehydrogenase [Candidatus Dormibacteraeota bacterium]|nr:zinc-binding dehydrogenase [Candidatus Dormibacteraeota bacterium]